MDGNDSNDATYVEDFPTPEGQVPPIRRFKAIGAGYFETMENAVLAGRTIAWSDIHTRARIVVVTENFAREYWKTADGALGKRIRNSPDGAWWQIVGVVGDAHDDGVSQPAKPIVYWPMLMADFYGADIFTYRSMGYVIRSSRVHSEEFLAQVREAVWSVNPRLPVANVQGLDELLERSMARTGFALVMLAIAAGIALLLGTVGIYGVISYVVSQRTREIGVRMALGANAWDVRRLVLKHGLALAVIGVALGLVAALALSRVMTAILFGVTPVDALTYAVVATTLATIAVLASYIPARRATRVPPGVALRWE
jgi:predicted permease